MCGARGTIRVMSEMVVSFMFFVVAVFLLICLHRVTLRYGRRTLAIFLIYPISAFVFGWVMSWSPTVVVLYVLLSLLSFIWLITPVLGDTPPTSRIMAFLREHPGASQQSIVKLFGDRDMVEKRLDDLAAAGLVRKKGSRYTANAIGKLAAWFIAHYLKLIAWEPSV